MDTNGMLARIETNGIKIGKIKIEARRKLSMSKRIEQTSKGTRSTKTKKKERKKRKNGKQKGIKRNP